ISVETLLGRVRETALGAYAHQDLPFEKLVEELKPARSLDLEPLFQVMLIFQNVPSSERKLPDLHFSSESVDVETAKVDLTLTLVERGGEIHGQVEYATDLYDRIRIVRLMGHLRLLLEGIVADRISRVMDLPMLTRAEQAQVLEWNRTEIDYPADKCLHE